MNTLQATPTWDTLQLKVLVWQRLEWSECAGVVRVYFSSTEIFGLRSDRFFSESLPLANGLGEGLRGFKNMELFMGLFNQVFCFPLFILKSNCLSIVILSGFSAVRLAHSNPILAAIYVMFSISCSTSYISIFQLAFKITEGVEELRKIIEVKSTEFPFPTERKWIQQSLKSTPLLAMNVGGFHEAERESVPIFLNFVVNQILSLLLTF